MSEKVSASDSSMILPFTMNFDTSREPLSKEMERAAIFCYAEIERMKGGGVLRQAPERVAYLVETGYPFWLVPWNGLTLVMDGLKLSEYNLGYQITPNAKDFKDNLVRSSKTLDSYLNFLSHNIGNFQAQSSFEQTRLNGLVADTQFFNEFHSYLRGPKTSSQPVSGALMISPFIDQARALAIRNELETTRSEFQEEIVVLQSIMTFVDTTTSDFAKNIQNKIATTQEQFAEELKEIRNTVMPRVNELQEDFDRRMTELSKSFESQLLELQKEKIKLERARIEAEQKIAHAEEESISAAKTDPASEIKWKETIKALKKELGDERNRTKDVDARIAERESARTHEFFQVRADHESRIKEAEKDLLETEATRDAKIQLQRQKMGKLKELTANLIERVNKTMKLREANISELKRIGLQFQMDNVSLVYVPFYLVCYQSLSKKRYAVFLPALVNPRGLSVRLRGALGQSKIKKLLTPRFRVVTGPIQRLPALIERNAVFNRDLEQKVVPVNLLSQDKRVQIRSGLGQLRAVGWLSEREVVGFNQILG